MLDYTLFEPANLTAKLLLDANAVFYNPDKPFEFASGRTSPVYVDVRVLLGVPAFRSQMTRMLFNKFAKDIGTCNIDVIAGAETAGIPFATLLANTADKPLIYVRKRPKNHGRSKLIEGIYKVDQTVLLVDDLISEGVSKRSFVWTLSDYGLIVKHLLTVFAYGCFEPIRLSVTVHSLTDLQTVLDVAEDQPCYLTSDVPAIRQFASDPNNWGTIPKISC